jgi:hypothetical protein
MDGERRRYPRHDVLVAALCRRVTPHGIEPPAHGETTDLSFGGFGAVFDEYFEPGDVVDVDLVLSPQVVTVRSIVVDVAPDGDRVRLHCCYVDPPPMVARAITDFLTARST